VLRPVPTRKPTKSNAAGRNQLPIEAGKLFHQQHLAGALDRQGHAALVMSGQARVFAGQNPPLVRHKLTEQIGVLEIERIGGEVNFRLGPGGAGFGGAARAAAVGFLGVGLAGLNYLISR